MRLAPKLLVLAGLAATAFPLAGAAGASILGPQCPDGYYGVVVDNHDVCTNLLTDCPPGYTGVGVAGNNVCFSWRDVIKH